MIGSWRRPTAASSCRRTRSRSRPARSSSASSTPWDSRRSCLGCSRRCTACSPAHEVAVDEPLDVVAERRQRRPGRAAICVGATGCRRCTCESSPSRNDGGHCVQLASTIVPVDCASEYACRKRRPMIGSWKRPPPPLPAGVLARAVDRHDRRARARRLGLPSFLFGLLSQVHRRARRAHADRRRDRVSVDDAPRQHPAARRTRPVRRAPNPRTDARISSS